MRQQQLGNFALAFSLILLCLGAFTTSAQEDALTKIAFISDRTGTANIYMMNADGSQSTNLTNSTQLEDLPTWSPDGTILAFSRNTVNTDQWDVFTIALDGSPGQQITNGAIYTTWMKWSPNGSQLAFATAPLLERHVSIINADGSNEISFYETEGDTGDSSDNPTWSPDGSQLVFGSRRNDESNISVVNADGSGEKALTGAPVIETRPVFSPDGQHIAFHWRQEGEDESEIAVMNADGSGVTVLTDNDAFDGEIAWSPDSQQIMFATLRDGNAEVYVMNADGTNPVNLTNDPGLDYFAAWSPDGTQIAFTSDRDGNSEIYVMNADGTNPVNITNDPGEDYAPAWQPVTASGAVAAPPSQPTESGEAAPDATAAPTEAAAPTSVPPTEAPTEAPAAAVTCTVTALNNANLRSGPGTNFDRAGTVAANEAAEADGQAQSADGFTWYRLTTGAWIRADLVSAGDCSGLATVTQ
jgi:Tol biopolymer transport system component